VVWHSPSTTVPHDAEQLTVSFDDGVVVANGAAAGVVASDTSVVELSGSDAGVKLIVPGSG